jgi:hypothetical protein
LDRQQYNMCMKPHMTGTGLSKEERQANMCIGAKLCTGRASNEDEAAKLCQEAATNPKIPKAAKKGKKFCFTDLPSLSICMASNIDLENLNSANIQQVFADALAKCSGVKAKQVKKAARTIEQLNPEELETLHTIAKLSKQFEGKTW